MVPKNRHGSWCIGIEGLQDLISKDRPAPLATWQEQSMDDNGVKGSHTSFVDHT